MDYRVWLVPQLVELWLAPGSVGEHHDREETFAWFSLILDSGRFFLSLDENLRVNGFVGWIEIDRDSIELVRQHGGLRELVAFGLPVEPGEHFLLTHIISKNITIYRRLLRAVWTLVQPGCCVVSFRPFSMVLSEWVKK